MIAAHGAALAAGADGLIFAVTRADSGSAPTKVRLRLSYAGFEHAYGGGFGPRLALFAMPTCALRAPRLRQCRGMRPLRAVNDWGTRSVSFVTTVPPAAGATPTLFALGSTTSGGSGDFKATSLAPSSQWHVGLQTGDFTWSYPLRVPPAIGGASPSLTLNYDSGQTDGETAQDNSQPGQLGEGFSLTGAGGYIVRQYASCGDIISGKISETISTDQTYPTGDECWHGLNGFLSVGGHSTQLVHDQSTGTWHLGSDDGATVEFKSGANNGAYNGSYWEIIEPNGTQYFYGLGQLPGYQSGNTQTNSVWTMPVFGLGVNDPCHKPTYSTSYCPNMPWRWNLDLVVDPNGNATSYYYNTETNYYASDSYTNTATETDVYGTALPYTSGGTLTDVNYGMQDISTSSPDSGGNVYAHKAFNVHLSYVDRCSRYGNDDTADYSNSQTQSTCDSTHADWPDTPWDLSCASASGCTGSGHAAPAFFDTKMLATVTTSVEQGFNNPEDVDTWTLGYDWNAADVNDDLVMKTIVHEGEAGSGTKTLAPVTFEYDEMNNRVDYGEKDTSGVDFPLMERYRITSVISETGGQTDITYNKGTCAASEPTDPSANTLPCFPQYWTAGDFGGSPTVLWFYKYTVSAVGVNDETGGQPEMDTFYTYCNNAACTSPGTGAAWHFDTDSGLVPDKDKSYGQWRGYAYVQVVAGTPGSSQSETDYTFLRGMDSDPLPGGGFSSVSVSPSHSSGSLHSVTDSNALNGFQLEKISYDGVNTAPQVSDEIDWPWLSPATATTANQPWGAPITAELTGTAETDTYLPLSSGKTRHTQVDNTFDSTTGLLTKTDNQGDVADPSQEQCTNYAYPSPPSTAGLINFPAEVKVTAGPCGAAGPALVSDTEYSYDGQANGTPPISGNVTETDVYSAGDPGVPAHWVKQYRGSFDPYGRKTSSENSAGFTTTTTYTSSFGTGYATTTTSVKSPLTASAGETVTADINPEWGTTADVTDPDNEVTDYVYDPLGRVTQIWLPGNPQSTTGTPDYAYAYNLSATVPSTVTTTRLVSGFNDPVTSVQFFDSLLRPLQTQAPAKANTPDQMQVSDTFYDALGNIAITNAPYTATGTPSKTWFNVLEAKVPSETVNTYDGANRVIETDLLSSGALKHSTTWDYSGADEVTKIPPSGGTITSTYTDAQGRTTEIDQYHSKTSASGNYDATAYSYDPITGKLAQITDATGNQWTYGYDLLGRQISATDPDTGTTSSTYDDLSQLTSVTDGAGKTVSYTYDAAGRKTGEYASTVAGQAGSNQLAAWTYDQSTITGGTKKAYGLPYSSTSYVGGTAGEAYTETIGSYDQGDNPTSTIYNIPTATVTGSLAGSYEFDSSYNLDDDTLSTFSYPAAGGLDAETDNYIYNQLGDPATTWGTLDGVTQEYLQQAFFDGNGQTVEIDLGASTSAAWTRMQYSYDQATDLLKEAKIASESGTSWIPGRDIGYSYNDEGNLISAVDSVTGNTSCYQYDYLTRLTASWNQSSATCPATVPAAAGLGGAAPYEQTFSYSNDGTANGSTNGTAGTISGTTLIAGVGSSATATATTYTYPADGSDQPHAPTLTSVKVNGGSPVTSNSTWNAPGQLTKISTGGTTTASYNWDGSGAAPDQLFSASTGGTTTNYRYDANGNLLLVKDGGTATLYLPNEELTASGSKVTAARYYTAAGQTIAVRTPTSEDWLFADPQGTDTTLVDSSTQALTSRYYTAFGAPLATVPTTTTWPGNRGYVGGTTDQTTGLTNLGAREYNPVSPSFISPDPILDPTTPADLDPYSYAYGDPVNQGDPSGLYLPSEGGTCQYYEAGCQTAADSNPNLSIGDVGAGFLNGIYEFGKSSIVLWGFATGDPALGMEVAKHLPARLPIGNPNNPSYGLGEMGAAGIGLLIPGADEIAAAALGIDEAAAAVAGAADAAADEASSAVTSAAEAGARAPEDAGVTGARGPASGRDFDPAAAGGPVRSLNAGDANITDEGVRAVAAHLQRFAGDGVLEAPEQGMLDRLLSVSSGDMEPTPYDLNFYTHELDEAGRYAQLGYGPESGVDLGSEEMFEVWNDVHTGALEDYGISDGDLFFPGLKP